MGFVQLQLPIRNIMEALHVFPAGMRSLSLDGVVPHRVLDLPRTLKLTPRLN